MAPGGATGGSGAGGATRAGGHSEVLFGPAELARAAGQVARGIGEQLAEENPVLVAILRGATVFLADVARGLSFPCEFEFLSISPFGEGRVRIESDLSVDIAGRHVVVVEDIVDTGLTLTYLLGTLQARGPASLQVATLLDKNVRRLVEVPVRWRGFEIDDRFVVGYGMDFGGLYRNLREVRVVHDLAALVAQPDLLVPEAYSPAALGA
jgi:hypoxanthine phosphoribosyltransferase